MNEILKRDQNFVTVLGGITNDSDQDVTMLRVDPITKRLLVSATGVLPSDVITGTGVAGQVAIWDGPHSQIGDSHFLWDKNTYQASILGTQGTAETYDLASGTLNFVPSLNNITSMILNNAGTKYALFSYDNNKSIFIYDIATGTYSNQIHLSDPLSVSASHVPMIFSDDDSKLYVGDGAYIDEIDVAGWGVTPHFYTGRDTSVCRTMLIHSGFLYVGFYNDGIAKIDLSDFSVNTLLSGPENQTYDMQFLPNFTKIYAATATGSGNIASVIDVSSFTTLATINLTFFNITTVKVTPNGLWAMFLSDTGYLSKVNTSTDTLTTQINIGFVNSVKSIQADNTNVYFFKDNATVSKVDIATMTVGSTTSIVNFPYDTYNYNGLIYIATYSTGTPSKLYVSTTGDDGSGAVIQAGGSISVPFGSHFYQGTATLIANPLTEDLNMNNFNITNFNALKDSSGFDVINNRNLINSTGSTMMYWGNDNVEMFPPHTVNMNNLSVNGSMGTGFQGGLAVGGTVNVQNSAAIAGGTTDEANTMAVAGGHTNPGTSGGQYSFAHAGNTYAYDSVVFHFGSETRYQDSFAMLGGKTYSQYSNSSGQGTEAWGAFQTVIGYQNIPQGNKFSTNVAFATDLVFAIGNGGGGFVSQPYNNALEVAFNGDTLVNGVFTSGLRYTQNPPFSNGNSLITYTLNPGDPYFIANNTNRFFTIYAKNTNTGVFDAIGYTSDRNDANDGLGYEVDLQWNLVTNSTGYLIYDVTGNQYVDVGNVSSFILLGSTVMTPGAPTLSPTVIYSGDSAHFPSPVQASYLTPSTVVISDGSSYLQSSAVTDTELGYLSGVTSAIQTQLNAKGVGTVTSVDGSGGSTGLTLTGGAITSSGTLTLGGILNIANGGTGASTLLGAGISKVVANADLTGQTAAITTTTLFTPATTGFYRISIYLQVTTPGTTSVLGGATGVVITFKDGDGNVTQTDTVGLTAPNGTVVTTLNTNTTATNLSGSLEIYARSGTAITYAIGYTSVGTAMQFSAHLSCEYIR